ncbi:hypothetical protein LBMAG15_11820 [Actinomycetes bacterium]|nr:hypothetical protein LBMAG15_11820 [Actinomycetes bacterium]
MASTRIDRTERLLNLVFCLMASRHAVRRADIQASVPGYLDAPSDAAFERMFERDKDELRGMGIPIDTVNDVNGEVEGYRISLAEYELTGLSFTTEELAVLTLAASVWDEAIMAPAATTALRKLEAAQESAVITPTFSPGVNVRWSETDAAILPLFTAVREQRVVSFDYRSGNAPVSKKRRVDPWAVVAEDGHWYVVGHDHDRADTRVFRLSRIAGTVQVFADPQLVSMPPGCNLRALVGAHEPDSPFEAKIFVRAGQGAELRRLNQASTKLDPFAAGELCVGARTSEQLQSLACAAGTGALVLEPENLREDVRAALRRIQRVHGGA